VANGSDLDGSNGRSGSGLSGIASALENRVVLLFSAAALGVGGNLAIVGTSVDSRADPFTGTEGRELERMIHQLQQKQALDDQHRLSAVDGYARIRTLESQQIINAQRIERVLDEMKRMRDEIQELR